MRRISIAIALTLAACGGSNKPQQQPPPPPPAAVPDAGTSANAIPESLRQETEAAIALVGELAAAAESIPADTDADCARTAAALQQVADGPNGKAIVTIDADPAFQEYAAQINESYGTQLDAAADKLSSALARCSYDPKVEQILVQAGVLDDEADSPPADDDVED